MRPWPKMCQGSSFFQCFPVFCSIACRKSRLKLFFKKNVLKNFAKFVGKYLCNSLFFNKVAGWGLNYVKKETLTQVFSCEFREIFKIIFLFYTTPLENWFHWLQALKINMSDNEYQTRRDNLNCNKKKKEQILNMSSLWQIEAAPGGVLWKKPFLKISQYSQKTTCAGVSFFIKLQP